MRVLITTDLAISGYHIPDVDLVINFEVPVLMDSHGLVWPVIESPTCIESVERTGVI